MTIQELKKICEIEYERGQKTVNISKFDEGYAYAMQKILLMLQGLPIQENVSKNVRFFKGTCLSCGHVVLKCNYCIKCGQLLKWEVVENGKKS